MHTFTVPKQLPSILLALVTSLLLALVFLGFQGCSTDQVLTPIEKQQVDANQAQIDTLTPQATAAEKDARAAGQEFLDALKNADPAAQSAALQHFEAARDTWGGIIQQMQTLIAQQDSIVSAAQQRAAAPVEASATLLGVPAGWVELVGALGLPLLFDRSRKNMLDTLKNALKGNLADAILGPLKTYGLLHTTTDPNELLNKAHVEAVKQGDDELALQILAAKNGVAGSTAAAPAGG